MKIPKYNEIEPEIRSLSVDDIFNLSMSDLATQDIHDALQDIVIYIKKTDSDLSKELIALSKHPRSTTLTVKVARKMCHLQDDLFRDKVKGELGNSSSSKHLPQRDADTGNESDVHSSDERAFMEGYKDKVINWLKGHDWSCVDVVLVNNDGHLVESGVNDPRLAGKVNLGLDALKLQILHYLFNNGDDGSSDGSLDKPNPEDPVDQAGNILHNLGFD